MLYKHVRKAVDGNAWPQYEHIVIAERALGHQLPDGAEIHHVNESKHDNSNSNLVICQNHGYHRLLHSRMRIKKAGGNPNSDKICGRCKQVKPKTDFNLNASLGHAPYCKPCESDWKRLRYQPTDHPRRRRSLNDGTALVLARISIISSALQDGRDWAYVDLARLVNVCVRTLRRDLRALVLSGTPIKCAYRTCRLLHQECVPA